MKNIFHAKKKKAGIIMLLSENTDVKSKAVIGNKEGHCIIIKGSIQQKDELLQMLHTQSRRT